MMPVRDLRISLAALAWFFAYPGNLAAAQTLDHVLIAPGLGSQSVDQRRPETVFRVNSLVNDGERSASPFTIATPEQAFIAADGTQ